MKFKEIFSIFALSTILTTIFTWPFITKITSFYRDYGDFPLVTWILWYTQFSFKIGTIWSQSLYLNGTQFYPLPYTLVYSEHMFIPSLIFTPIFLLTNNLILSTNFFIFLTFVLSFLTSYFTIKYFVKNIYASIIGATIYTFNPITFFQLPHHYNYMNKYFLPLVILFAFKYLIKPTLRNSFLFFTFFTLNALTLVYFQAFSIIAILIMCSIFFIYKIYKKDFYYFLTITKYSLVFLIFVPILFYFNSPYLEFSKKENIVRTIRENEYFSAKPIEWLTPNRDNFAYNNLTKFLGHVNKELDWDFKHKEPTLFLNILPTLLMILGIIYFLKVYKNKKINQQELLLFISFYASLIIIFILTLGPLSIWFNLKFPFYYLYEYLPILQGIRVPSRFQFMFYVFFSLFSAYGAMFLFTKIKKKYISMVFIIIIIILFIENYNLRSYNETSSILKNFDDINFKKQISFLKNKNTVHLPIYTPGFENETRYINWSIMTEERIMNGNSGYYPNDLLIFLEKLNKNLNMEALNELNLFNINYIIIHKNLLEKDSLENYKKNHNLYKYGTAFENKQLLIVDLNKYSTTGKKCIRENFLAILNENLSLNKNWKDKISIKNNNNCYVVNKYYDRYFLYSYNFSGKIQNTYIKLPVLIKPYEKFNIEVNHN